MTKLKAKKPTDVTPGHCKGILFGKSGVGKTWFALNFPTPYYIDSEGGARLGHYLEKLKAAGGSYLGPDEGALDFDTIIDQVKALATEKHQYKTLIIDSITKVYHTAIANEAERLGSKDAFGASKKPAIAQMRRLINWIDRLDMNCWFVAHDIAEWGMVKGERQEIGRIPDVWDKTVYELDLTLKIENKRKRFRTATVTKTRLLGFPEYEVIQLQDGDKDLGYAEFSKRYGQDYIEADSKPIVLCNEEQRAKIKMLLDILKIEDKEIKKVLAKAKAETFAELTMLQADKFIEWLQKKGGMKNAE